MNNTEECLVRDEFWSDNSDRVKRTIEINPLLVHRSGLFHDNAILGPWRVAWLASEVLVWMRSWAS
jgi:hypothetical protein